MDPENGMTWTQIIFSQIIRFGGVLTILFILYLTVVATGKIMSKLSRGDSQS